MSELFPEKITVERWRAARDAAERHAFTAWRERRDRWRTANGLPKLDDEAAASIYASEQRLPRGRR